jgi:hypothetical protein
VVRYKLASQKTVYQSNKLAGVRGSRTTDLLFAKPITRLLVAKSYPLSCEDASGVYSVPMGNYEDSSDEPKLDAGTTTAVVWLIVGAG